MPQNRKTNRLELGKNKMHSFIHSFNLAPLRLACCCQPNVSACTYVRIRAYTLSDDVSSLPFFSWETNSRHLALQYRGVAFLRAWKCLRHPLLMRTLLRHVFFFQYGKLLLSFPSGSEQKNKQTFFFLWRLLRQVEQSIAKLGKKTSL